MRKPEYRQDAGVAIVPLIHVGNIPFLILPPQFCCSPGRCPLRPFSKGMAGASVRQDRTLYACLVLTADHFTAIVLFNKRSRIGLTTVTR
jgi:hypothetical protein